MDRRNGGRNQKTLLQRYFCFFLLTRQFSLSRLKRAHDQSSMLASHCAHSHGCDHCLRGCYCQTGTAALCSHLHFLLFFFSRIGQSKAHALPRQCSFAITTLETFSYLIFFPKPGPLPAGNHQSESGIRAEKTSLLMTIHQLMIFLLVHLLR